MYEFDNEASICRCGSRVYVKILHDQWFLQYSDPAWKVAGIRTPERYGPGPSGSQDEFERTVDWLKDWACTTAGWPRHPPPLGPGMAD